MAYIFHIRVVEAFVRDNLTSQGMVADIAIHNPPKTNDRHQPIDKDGNVTRDVNEMQFVNPHAHILCTVRPMDEQGVWEKKSEVEYLCKKDGEERAFTAAEFRVAKEDGWEKQYRYYEGKECSPLQIKKKAELQKQIQEEQGNIEHRSEYMQGIARMCQLPTEEDFKNAAKKHSKKVEDFSKLEKTIEAIQEDSEKLTVEYKATVEAIPEESKQAVKEKRDEERPEAEAVVKAKLSSKHGESLDEDVYESSKKAVDKAIEPAEKAKELIDVQEKVVTKSRHH